MSDTAEVLLGEVVDWLGAPDWTGPQLPNDLARRIAATLGPVPIQPDVGGAA